MLKRIRKFAVEYSYNLGEKTGLDFPYFVKNGFWVILNQAVILISGLILSIVYARFLLKEIYGTYQLIISILSIVSILTLPGLNTSIMRSVSRGYDGSYKKAIQLSFKWSLIGIPIIVLIAVYFWFHKDEEVAIALVISSLLFPLLYAPNTWMSFLQGKSKFELYAKWNAIQSILSTLIFSVIAILMPDFVFGILMAYLVTNSLFNAYFYRKSRAYIENDFEDNETISYGSFITKMQLLGLIVNHFDKLIVGLFDVKILAVYIIALKLLDIVKGFAKSLFSITFPKFASKNIHIGNLEILALVLAGLAVSFLIYFMAELVVRVLYTNKFYESALFLKKLVWVIPLFFSYFFMVQKVSAQKNEKKVFQLQVIPAALALVSSILVLIFTRNLEYFVLCKVYILYLVSFLLLIKS